MEILFKREQTKRPSGKVVFKLWGKAEFDTDEKQIISRYRFDEAVLIYADQPQLLRQAIGVAVAMLFVGGGIFSAMSKNFTGSFGLSAVFGVVAGYLFYHQRRETIFVRDLIHGRDFTCTSVVDLARKEAWLEYVCGFLRQVMESAKHWDGTEKHTIEPLPKDEARQVIIKGL